MTPVKKHCVPDRIRMSCFVSFVWDWWMYVDPARAIAWKYCPFLLLPHFWLARASCLHCSSTPCGSAMPFDKVRSFLHFSDRLLNHEGFLRLYSINGFGKAFWLDCNLISWVSQATTAIHRTDPDGITTKRDYADTCANTGTKLPAYQTEPVQQPNHNTLWLSEVRHPTMGIDNSAFSSAYMSLWWKHLWHNLVWLIACQSQDCISFVNSSHFCLSNGENLSDSVDCFWEQASFGSSGRWLADSGDYDCCTVPY